MTDISEVSEGASDYAVYRGMTRSMLDAAYNNGLAVADSDRWLAIWRSRSDAIRNGPGARLDISYGPKHGERLDYFTSGRQGAPLFVFLHGGYWQRNDKNMFAFAGEGARQHGLDFAVVGYTLAPEAGLTEIVSQIHRSLTFLTDPANGFEFDPKRLVVGGWSAGGHLTAAVAGHSGYKAGLAISGIFDLEPISLSYLNEKLKLTPTEVLDLSPMKQPAQNKRLALAAGEKELAELKRQSEAYCTKVKAEGAPVSLRTLRGHHHYSILDELFDRDGSLTAALLELTS